jgi:hypothetical protein
MHEHARSWLADRAADVPPSLQARLVTAVGDVVAAPSAPVWDVLATAAFACLDEAAGRCDDRDAALELLAADALITGACEAAAAEPAALRALHERFAPTRLAALLPAVSAQPPAQRPQPTQQQPPRPRPPQQPPPQEPPPQEPPPQEPPRRGATEERT